MEPNPRNISNLLNHDSPSQYSSEGSGQFSPPTPQSQFPFGTSNFLQNFNPFGPPGIHPPYGHSPLIFQGVHQPGSWLQARPPMYGFTDVLDTDMEIRDGSTHTRLKEDLIEHI